ncbi:MAG: hypothetical protein WCF91_03865 [bacterium]
MKKRATVYLVAISAVLIITAVLLVLSLFTTNPTRLGPAGVTFWFINALVMVSALMTVVSFKFKTRNLKNQDNQMALFKSSLRFGSLIGFSIVGLLALSSLRSLSWRDILLFILIVIVVEVFFRTRKKDA